MGVIDFNHAREPLNKSGRIKLRLKMIKIKAWNARNSRAIAKFHNAEIDYFGLKLIGHDLFRGSLAAFRYFDESNV